MSGNANKFQNTAITAIDDISQFRHNIDYHCELVRTEDSKLKTLCSMALLHHHSRVN